MIETILKAILENVLWPIIVFFAIVCFRKPLSDLITRIQKVKFGGVDVDTSTKQQPVEIDSSNIQQVTEIRESTNPIQTDRLKKVAEMIDGKPEGEKTYFSSWIIADLNQKLYFEKIYRIIFSSQISILKSINSFGSAGVTADIRQSHFNAVMTNSPSAVPFNIEQYFDFLISTGFIEKTDDGNTRITEEGQDFLIWMVSDQLPEQTRSPF